MKRTLQQQTTCIILPFLGCTVRASSYTDLCHRLVPCTLYLVTCTLYPKNFVLLGPRPCTLYLVPCNSLYSVLSLVPCTLHSCVCKFLYCTLYSCILHSCNFVILELHLPRNSCTLVPEILHPCTCTLQFALSTDVTVAL
jgi:hypothetical protein